MSGIIRDHIISYISHNSEADIYVISGGYVFLSYDWASWPPILASMYRTGWPIYDCYRRNYHVFSPTPHYVSIALFDQLFNRYWFPKNIFPLVQLLDQHCFWWVLYFFLSIQLFPRPWESPVEVLFFLLLMSAPLFNLFVPSFNLLTLSVSLPSKLLLSANLLVSLLPPFFLYPPCFFQPPCLLTLQISPTGLPLFPKLLHLLTVSSSLLLKFTLLDPLLCLPNSRRRPHDTLYPMCHFNFRADVVPHCQFHRVYSFKGPL